MAKELTRIPNNSHHCSGRRHFLGYPDEGKMKILQTGKSTENNADIFAAFTALADTENALVKHCWLGRSITDPKLNKTLC